MRMTLLIAATTNAATEKANPQIALGLTGRTGRLRIRRHLASWLLPLLQKRHRAARLGRRRLGPARMPARVKARIATHWACAVFPSRQALAVKCVMTKCRGQSRNRTIHALQTHGTRRKLNTIQLALLHRTGNKGMLDRLNGINMGAFDFNRLDRRQMAILALNMQQQMKQTIETCP